MRATKRARDGVYHQEQAVLRNNVSDINSLWQFVKIWWSWRSASVWRAWTSLVLISLGLLHLLGFAAASILAFHMTTTGDQVLLASSSACGPWCPLTTTEEVEDEALSDACQSYFDSTVVASSNFVQNCLASAEFLPECDKYQRKQLNWTSTKVPCIYDGLCLGDSDGTLQMSTALLDSRDDFGINSRDDDRIQLKKIATCVPINPNNYTRHGNMTINYYNPNGGGIHGAIKVNYTAMLYGASAIDDGGSTDFANVTYVYTNFRDAATTFQAQFDTCYDIM